ncbi:MAG: pilus assembly protein PilM [Bdellovibrionales bacterium]|nr:pilus assembly protein PilM [Bdellovibrionales bacterium]
MITLGVDIGKSSIKVAEVEGHPKGFSFKRFLEFPLSNDPTKDKKIEIIDHLRNLAAQYDSNQVQFVFGIAQEKITQRYLTFPFRERHKILKIVPFELEDDIPLTFADSIFEAKVIRYKRKITEVLALATLKENVQESIDLIRDGSCSASILSGQSLALSNLLEKWYIPPPEVVDAGGLNEPHGNDEEQILAERPGEILIDLGHSGSRVLFYEEGRLIAIRNLDWGGQNVIQGLASKYSLNPVQARKEMEKKAFILLDKENAQKDQIVFSEAIESSMAPLVNQLRLALFEVQSQFHLTWVRAHILGGPAQIKGLSPFLTRKLEIPFNLFHHFQLLNDLRFDADPRIEMVSGTALGLALEGLRKPRNPAINFLKGEFAIKSKSLEQLWEKWAYTAQLSLVALVAFFIYASLRVSFMEEAIVEAESVLKKQAQSIANKRGSEASPSKLRRFLSQHQKEVRALDQAKKLIHMKTPLDIVNQLSQELPANAKLEVKNLFIDEDFLEVHGDVQSSSQVSKIQMALKTMSSDNKVTRVNSKVRPAPGKAPFSYRIRIQRTGEG